MSTDDDKKKSADEFKTRVYGVGTLLAVIIAVPAIATALIMNYVIKADFIVMISASLISLFIAMGFVFKLAKRLVKTPDGDPK